MNENRPTTTDSDRQQQIHIQTDSSRFSRKIETEVDEEQTTDISRRIQTDSSIQTNEVASKGTDTDSDSDRFRAQNHTNMEMNENRTGRQQQQTDSDRQQQIQ
ncbi:hypothetical protein Tco_1193176 [Tanacetum coccineum]